MRNKHHELEEEEDPCKPTDRNIFGKILGVLGEGKARIITPVFLTTNVLKVHLEYFESRSPFQLAH
jgi:hypothetical protein